jgi:hypothetical protein
VTRECTPADPAPLSLDIADPATWPVRMTRREIATVLRISERGLRRRIIGARFPAADDGRTWARDMVIRYCTGGITRFEKVRRSA